MQVQDHAASPPSPAGVRSFADLTTQLRELFVWCGRPKYATLSKASGLAPSAISTLIGKRPSRRPSEATTLRFVEACLIQGGYSSRAADDRVEEWRRTWARLDAAVEDAEKSRDDAPRATEPPRAHRGPLLAGIAAVVLVVGVGLGVALGSGLLRGGGSAEPKDGSSAPRAVCARTSIPEAHDVRHARVWTSGFACPTDQGAAVRAEPDGGSLLVSRLTHAKSWFVCWTRGKEHAGGNAIWYYTQGDTHSTRAKLHSWGYVAANQLGTEHDPDPAAFRRCPAG